MPKIIGILLIALVLEALGVVFLSSGLKQIGEVDKISASEVIRILKRGITNRNILLGILFEAIFFGALLYLLSKADVSLVWPLTSLGFLLTALAAKLFLHETISPMRWGGICLVVLGAALISYSEKSKQQKMKVATSAEQRSIPE